MSSLRWPVAAAAAAVVAVLLALLVPAVAVGADPSFADLLCASVTLTCGLILVAHDDRRRLGGLLLLATAVAWALPLLDLVLGGPAGRALAATTLVHLGTLTAAVLVALDGRVAAPVRWITGAGAALTALSGAVGGYAVAMPVLGLLVGVAAARGRGPARHAGLVLAALLVGEAAARAAGLEAEDLLFVLHAGGVTLTAVLATAALHRTPAGPMRIDLDTAGLRDLDEALARILGSPGLRVKFAGSGGDGDWLDALGRPAGTPSASSHVVHDPGGNGPIAALEGLSGELPAHVVTTLRVVRDHARLRHAATDQLVALADSRRRLLVAGDAERQDLERRLRAGPVRRVEVVRAATASTAGLDDVRRRAGLTRTALLEVARGLDPLAGRAGLADALAALAEGPVHAEVTCPPTADRAVDAVRRTVWFVCAEGVANAGKHAPSARVRIDVAVPGDRLRVTVDDDGPGGADASGRGLSGLADRARAVGGRLEVRSEAGGGTRLLLDLPLDGNAVTR